MTICSLQEETENFSHASSGVIMSDGDEETECQLAGLYFPSQIKQ